MTTDTSVHPPIKCTTCGGPLAFLEYATKEGKDGRIAKWPVYEKCTNPQCTTGAKNLRRLAKGDRVKIGGSPRATLPVVDDDLTPIPLAPEFEENKVPEWSEQEPVDYVEAPQSAGGSNPPFKLFQIDHLFNDAGACDPQALYQGLSDCLMHNGWDKDPSVHVLMRVEDVGLIWEKLEWGKLGKRVSEVHWDPADPVRPMMLLGGMGQIVVMPTVNAFDWTPGYGYFTVGVQGEPGE